MNLSRTSILFALLCIGIHAFAQSDDRSFNITAWWNSDHPIRVPILVNTGSVPRVDKPVEAALEIPKGANAQTLRLIEIDLRGQIQDERLPTQFDLNEEKNQGELTFILIGETPANSQRLYHAYFMQEGKENDQKKVGRASLASPTGMTPTQVEENVEHEGQESYKITTLNATYYYHKRGAGFASMEDRDGNDWLSYNPGVGEKSGSGSGGKYRGLPNMGHPEGYCHPGNTVSNSELLSRGPLKVSIRSRSDDGKMQCRWDIFPNHARMTVEKMRTPYWFLYEGTPGGEMDMNSDFCVRPGENGGIRTLVSEKWEGDITAPGEPGEWLYFGDGQRIVYLIHHQDDDATDSYWPMNEEMTVFGFGRLNLNKYMDQVPSQFTVGFHDRSDYESAKAAIQSAYLPMQIHVGQVERLAIK